MVPLRQAQSNRNGNRHHSGTRHGDAGSGLRSACRGLVCGILGGILCYYATRFVLGRLLVDDSLDVFAVHGVGGILGTLLVAVLGAETFGGLGLENGIASQFISQATGVVAVVVWSVLATWLIVLLTRAMVGLRASEKEEAEGLDFESHGERGYTS